MHWPPFSSGPPRIAMVKISLLESAASMSDGTAPRVSLSFRDGSTFERRRNRETQSWILRALRIGCIFDIAVINDATVSVNDETVGSRFRPEQVRERIVDVLENRKVVFHCSSVCGDFFERLVYVRVDYNELHAM